MEYNLIWFPNTWSCSTWAEMNTSECCIPMQTAGLQRQLNPDDIFIYLTYLCVYFIFSGGTAGV